MSRLGPIKDSTETGVFRIIDNWSHMFIGEFTYDEAVERFGDCEIWAGWTEEYDPDPKNKRPFTSRVWVDIPGMKLIGSHNNTVNIIGGNRKHAEFIGRKSGMKIIVDHLGSDDYSVCWMDESRQFGHSMRGSMADIVREIEEEI